MLKKTSCALRRGGIDFRCPKNCNLGHKEAPKSQKDPRRHLWFVGSVTMDRRRVGVRDKAHAATCFVLVRGADRDAFFGFKCAL